MKKVLASLMVFLGACGGPQGEAPANPSPSESGPPTPKPQNPNSAPTADTDDGEVDLNGAWVAYGTVRPAQLWSINHDHPGQFPREFQTRCKVTIQIVQRPDYLHVVSAQISFPDVQKLRYFHAKMLDQVQASNGQVIEFHRAEFQLQETESASREFRLAQIERDGKVQTPHGKDLYSEKQRRLQFASRGPYVGTYKNGQGATHTAIREFDLSWSKGQPTFNSISFWSDMSGDHYTDALCENAPMQREVRGIEFRGIERKFEEEPRVAGPRELWRWLPRRRSSL